MKQLYLEYANENINAVDILVIVYKKYTIA